MGIANDGVGTNQIGDGAVTASKIAAGQVVKSINGLSDGVTLAAGSNVSIQLTGQTLTIASMLGLTSVGHDNTLQGDGTSGSPLGIANLGVGTNQLADSAITAQKIAPGQVVTGINNLRDTVTLAAGSNVTITPSGNTLTIASQQPYINPLRVATLRWYAGNDTGAGLSFGQSAVGLVCDGAHMWVTVGTSLMKFRPSDGVIVGTFSTQAGGTGGPMTFDGANIWVAITDNPLILKFRASDGALIGTFSLSGIAQELAFDGFDICAAIGTKLFKLRPSDAVAVEVFELGSAVQGLAIDNNFRVWATLSNGTVARILQGDDLIVTHNVGIDPRGIAFDGVNMWIANSGNKFVTKLRGSDGAFLGNFNIAINIGNPSKVAFDGANMWVTTSGGRVERFPVSTGVPGRTFSAGTNPAGIAFDGANIWVAHSSGVNKL
ncbi:MAG TPA: hypothetical protein VFZ22_02405 [Pyrinomonadaceae bacterium]|nr:hypothetical protein [Pyrinomonadaceae bacterium]